MIHLSNSFRYFLSFYPSVILREWLENLKEFEGRGLIIGIHLSNSFYLFNSIFFFLSKCHFVQMIGKFERI